MTARTWNKIGLAFLAFLFVGYVAKGLGYF